jgi:hypothetical protein
MSSTVVAVAADAFDQFAQFGGFGGVHAGRRLVQAQQLGFGGQGTGNFQPALVAVGQVLGQVVGPVLDAHVMQQVDGALADRRFLGRVAALLSMAPSTPALGPHMAADHDVFQRRHVAEQADVLEGAGDAALGRLVRRIGHQRRAGED